MRHSSRLWAASASVLLSVGLMRSDAGASYFGQLNLKPGETKQVYIAGAARNVRVCNDFFSSGQAVVTIANNPSHDLLPGVCAEDIGDRMIVLSHASGRVRIYYRQIYDQGHELFEE